MPVPVATAVSGVQTYSIHGFEVPVSFQSNSKLVFTLNRTKFQLSTQKGDDLDLTLLEFIRSKGFTGTKLGCGEGGCGACTVVVGKYDALAAAATSSKRTAPFRYKSVNACLLPLVAVHGCHVLTVEGIGTSENPHPIQQRIGKLFGSQCGFCTPGIVMSLYATIRNGYGSLTEQDIEHSLDGCLCRCTGYRPILDAAKSFATVKPNHTTHESLSQSGALLSSLSDQEKDLIIAATKQPCAKGDQCCMVKGKSAPACGTSLQAKAGIHTTSDAIRKTLDPTLFKPYEPDTEPIFPPYLSKQPFDSHDLVFVQEFPEDEPVEGEENSLTAVERVPQVWLRPGSLQSLVDCIKMYGAVGAKIRSGNTETGIEVKFKHLSYSVSIFVSDHLKDVAFYSSTSDALTVGANLCLTDLANRLRAENLDDEYAKQVRDAILDNLRYFASNQIRNVATLAGNIATASPISDLNPIWVATGAQLFFIDPAAPGSEQKSINMRDVFLGYRKTALPSSAILTKLVVPWKQADGVKTFIQAFKQSKRKDDDIAVVNGCLRASIDSSTGLINDATLAYGGMGPTTVQSQHTQNSLIGKRFQDPATLDTALKTLSSVDLALSYNVPGGMTVYRKSLALGFLVRFFSIVAKNQHFTIGSETMASQIPQIEQIADSTLHRPVTHGQQDLEDVVVQPPVGSSVPHLSAMKQVTGEAIYIDDMPPVANELHAGFVLSQKAHAILKQVDPTEALQMPGVVDFISVKDIPQGGSNIWGPPAMDDVFFAEDKVYTVGQIIGLVVAETKRQAQAAARRVKIEYEELESILTIDEAIANNSFFKPRPVLKRGEFDDESCWQGYDHVVEGETRMGGQEHFYLETNAHLVVPGKEDSEMEVFSSTQNPSETQVFCASIIGVPTNRVTCRTKRLGGGFGGKESRTLGIAVPLTLAAKKLGRPVRCMLDRDEDMVITGQRHPFYGKWKVAFSKHGKLERFYARLYNNGGYSQDLSQAVLERAMFHIDNCYQIPNLKVEGLICKTNTMSNTAFRGFGGPQGMLICEDMITRVAATIAKLPEEVRELNLYKPGEETHFHQRLDDWNVPTLWTQLKQSGDFDRRRTEIDRFNADHRYKKRGISMIPTKFGISFTALFMNQANATIHIYHHDGSVLFSHGGTEMGQGLHTKMAQVVAAELDIPLSMVHLMETNTAYNANTSPTAASASSDLNGMALKDACHQLNQRLEPFRKRNPTMDRVESFKVAAHSAYFNRIPLSAIGHYQTPDIGYNWQTATGQPFFYFTQGVAISEVEIDVITGDSRIIRADIHMDIGRSINPSIDVGQIEGAFIQGYGMTTIEETLFLRHNGHLATKGPGTYKIPSFLDTPSDFRISFLKGQRNLQQLRTIQSSKGIGEPPLFLGSTVFFAIKDALSSARFDLHSSHREIAYSFQFDSPATPERIRLGYNDYLLQIALLSTDNNDNNNQQHKLPSPSDSTFFVSIF